MERIKTRSKKKRGEREREVVQEVKGSPHNLLDAELIVSCSTFYEYTSLSLLRMEDCGEGLFGFAFRDSPDLQ